MVDYKYADLFLRSHIDKQLKIEAYDGSVTFTNEDIHWEEFELTESLCSEPDLKFGSCEAAELKFKIANSYVPLTGKWLTVTETLEGGEDEPFQFGRYKVYSDIPTADRKYREVSAHDSMIDIINKEVSRWYEGLSFPISMKNFRDSFFSYVGVSQKPAELVNDGMTIEKTIEAQEISGKDVVCAICEANGAFGHIGRDGRFEYIYLKEIIEGLFPRNDLFPEDDLYPKDPNAQRIGAAAYISAQYEDYIKKKITMLQIRQEENDIGVEVGTRGNDYIIQGNFLLYGKSAGDLTVCARNIFNQISTTWYMPAKIEAVANPCLEVGDPIRTHTSDKIIYTYILNRAIKGIQAPRDAYEASGQELYTEKVNSVSCQVEQLKGKTNTLTRTAEETRSELSDLEENTNSMFLQTASQIQAEVSARQGEDAEIRASLSLKIDKGDDGTIISLIEGSADRIHFNANNMFRVTSPNFTIDDSGNVDIGGIITAYGSLYLDARLFPAGSPQKVNALTAKTTIYTHYESRGNRPKGIYSYSAGSSELAPILEIGKEASVVTTDKQLQATSIYAPEGLFAECVMTYADIANLWLMSSADGTYGGTVYQCNGSYGNEGLASPGWVKNYVSRNMPSVDLSGYMRRSVNVISGTQSVSYCLRNAYVSSSGGIEFTLQAINTSDARLKNIKRRLDDVTILYMLLVPEEFCFKPGMQGYDSTVTHFGVDAQATINAMEKAGINPSDYCLVFEEWPVEALGESTYVHDKVLKVDYNELHALHISMIQKQQKEIDELKRENMRLSGEITILNQKMEEILNVINHKDN